MEKIKSLKELAMPISEAEYRAMPALSYSTLAKYERGGFDSISTLFDSISTPSTVYGQLVDTLVTGTREEFEERYLVCDFPDISDTIIKIVKDLFFKYSHIYSSILDIPNDSMLEVLNNLAYQNNWKPETRCKVIKEKGEEYYNLLYLSQTKEIVSMKDYEDALAAYDALKNSDSTKWYFQPDNPFDGIERLYQLKFKATLNDIDYRIMADLIIVDHNNKLIIPADLKTSGKKEYQFHKSFKDWGYWWQGILYTKVLEANIKQDDYFKDFKIMPYIFIVVNRYNLTPLVWEFEDNHSDTDLVYGKNQDIIIRHPLNIGKELKYYLDSSDNVPIGINKTGKNSLKQWLNTL